MWKDLKFYIITTDVLTLGIFNFFYMVAGLLTSLHQIGFRKTTWREMQRKDNLLLVNKDSAYYWFVW